MTSIKDKFPIPYTDDIIRSMQDANYFNQMDVVWGYNNLRIKEGDEWKAAFITPRGLFEPTVMMFGQTNAPATFSRWMHHVFRDLIAAKKMALYMDDFYILGKTLKELEDN